MIEENIGLEYRLKEVGKKHFIKEIKQNELLSK